MIQRKKKRCRKCGEEVYLYARGMCLQCDRIENSHKHGQIKPSDSTSPKKGITPTKKKKIAPVSAKRLKQLKEYRPKRDKYMEEHPICEAPDCNNPSTELHHGIGRENERLLMQEHWVALCHLCHRKYTDDSKQAIEIGVSKSRLISLDRLK